MKYLFIGLILTSSLFAQTYDLKKGEANFDIKVMMKKVDTRSTEVKGKINCTDTCEYLLAIPLKTFTTEDSNRDLNMFTAIEADKFKVTTARGTFPKSIMKASEGKIEALIDFHGVKKLYPVFLKDKASKANLTLDLDAHGVELPSLFGLKMDRMLPVEFILEWHSNSGM